MHIRDIEWPRGIREKVERRHGLSSEQVESAVLDERAYVRRTREYRYFVFGRAEDGAYIVAVVAYEKGIVRMISARMMLPRERRTYQRRGK